MLTSQKRVLVLTGLLWIILLKPIKRSYWKKLSFDFICLGWYLIYFFWCYVYTDFVHLSAADLTGPDSNSGVSFKLEDGLFWTFFTLKWTFCDDARSPDWLHLRLVWSFGRRPCWPRTGDEGLLADGGPWCEGLEKEAFTSRSRTSFFQWEPGKTETSNHVSQKEQELDFNWKGRKDVFRFFE